MSTDSFRARPVGVLAALLLTSSLAAAQAPAPHVHDDEVGACGLEPPDAVYVPAPGPRAHEARKLGATDAPVVRREEKGGGTRAKVSGVPQTRTRAGALSGKVIYLSPGHGFYRAPTLKRWATQRPNTWAVVEDFISAEVLNQDLLPMLTGAGATVVPVRESDLNSRMVIVDDGGAGYSETGDTALFRATSRKGWGTPPSPMKNDVEPFTLGTTRELLTTMTATTSATWAPTVPADGHYHVYVSYAADPSRTENAHYVVRHAGGESHFRVNQRRHGGTWVFLGRFFFKAGAGADAASVVLMNDAEPGSTVSVDAVRFGGGSGVIGDAQMAALTRPRYEEAARYHVQFSGAPASVYAPTGANAIGNERNADVSARPRFAAWLHEEGEDAVYVAWHTNASTTGKVVGTEGYVYGPNPVDGTLNFTGVPGSDVLARALLDELGKDLRREVDPTWRVRNLRSANLGEVNPTHNPEMPSVLLEIAYHDTVADSNRLKEPAFRRVAARAILQGLIKYFAARDGVAVRLPPEAPSAVVARNTVAGTVEVRWAAPEANPDEEGHDAPTAYRVYQSTDGLGWDDGTEVTQTSFSLPLATGTARYFRVAAVSEGGEGFPSSIVGVRAGAAATALVVNAFERMDSALACGEALDAYDLEAPLRVLVEMMNDGTYVRRHGDAMSQSGLVFDSATSAAVAAGLVSPGAGTGYRVVDWFTGRGGAQGTRLTRAEQDALRAFVTGGGHLLLSGSQVASALAAGDSADKAFLADILRAAPLSGTPSLTVEGLPGDFLSSLTGVSLDDGTRGAFPVGVTDVLTPASGGSAVLRYAGTDLTAGVFSLPGGQVLLLGVPFESVVDRAARARLLSAFLVRAGFPSPGTAPVGDSGEGGPGLLARCVVPRGVDPHPPEPEIPTPIVLDALPQFYPLGDTGCGCGAGAGTGGGLWLLLGVIVQLRRARRRAGDLRR
ncbi:putative N-acetylmuramoyl-L-alanine amidase [Myxococcus stipitatus DSM 14675]|uniref:N-acetylmuramoyl-L-alanine amidase n=1 Tax=Myxococcus stipitatus (strain DSM 14675 / JCM 12634 / Mx s8) TaxID=1278073 RepID=L7U9M6_MYXSD|nr:N-acetylmuramoyl-L-alanine amidase [Myxococcus stipitatus]AGC44550.1 putative N-acetylmuramoyl-L-alanine amidase [Myxococcus stipitatus DSM 14675]